MTDVIDDSNNYALWKKAREIWAILPENIDDPKFDNMFNNITDVELVKLWFFIFHQHISCDEQNQLFKNNNPIKRNRFLRTSRFNSFAYDHHDHLIGEGRNVALSNWVINNAKKF